MGVIEIAHASSNLAVGTIQSFIDSFLKDGGAEKVDYVHGEDVVERLALQAGNVGFYLAGMHKSDLFKTVILDGALPSSRPGYHLKWRSPNHYLKAPTLDRAYKS